MVSIVIPAYNEETRLPRCLEPTISFLLAQDYDSEIIVVCDGCTDDTKVKAESYNKKYKNLKILEYFPNRGKGYAVKKGMLEARGDLRLFMDADYAVPIEFLSQFLRQVNEGYEIVIGSRGLKDTKIEKHQMFLRELAGKAFGRIQKIVLGIPYYDTQCGFKLFTKCAAEYLFTQLKYNCSYFDAELIYIAHLAKIKIKEMPIIWKHDGITRMPVGLSRTIDLFKKLFGLKTLHKEILEQNG